MVDIILRLWKE